MESFSMYLSGNVGALVVGIIICIGLICVTINQFARAKRGECSMVSAILPAALGLIVLGTIFVGYVSKPEKSIEEPEVGYTVITDDIKKELP